MKNIFIYQDHPGQLKCGFTPLIHVRTSKVPCKMVQIDWKCGKSTGNMRLDNSNDSKDDITVKYIEAGDQAQVRFAPLKPFVVQTFDVCKPLSRMAAMDSNSLVLMGKIVNVEYKNDISNKNSKKMKMAASEKNNT